MLDNHWYNPESLVEVPKTTGSTLKVRYWRKTNWKHQSEIDQSPVCSPPILTFSAWTTLAQKLGVGCESVWFGNLVQVEV
jgi:hypothetical protein